MQKLQSLQEIQNALYDQTIGGLLTSFFKSIKNAIVRTKTDVQTKADLKQVTLPPEFNYGNQTAKTLLEIIKDPVDQYIGYIQVIQDIYSEFQSEYKKWTPQKLELAIKKTQNLLGSMKQNIQKPTSLKTLNTDLAIVGLFEIFKGQGHELLITDEKNNNQQPFRICQAVLTGQIENMKFIQVSFTKFGDKSLCDIQKNDDDKQKLINAFIISVSNTYDVPKESVIILSVDYKNSQIDSWIGNNDSQISNYNVSKFSKEGFENTKIKIQSFLQYFKLSQELFDSNYNMFWNKAHENMIRYRGAIKFKEGKVILQRYKFPVGFYGFGLNVTQWIEIDKSEWFSQKSTEDTWIVLYHGTDKIDAVQKITQDKQINPGPNNVKGGQKCRITGEEIKGGPQVNTYLTDDAEVAARYCRSGIEINSVTYEFVFQCRVKPSSVRSPEQKQSFYTVEAQLVKEGSIRPYRLLIREKTKK